MYSIYVNHNILCDSRIDELAVISPTITKKANQPDSFVVTIPATHPQRGVLQKHTDIISVERNGEILFQGRMLRKEIDFRGNWKITCEGELGYLNDTIQMPFTLSKTQGAGMEDYVRHLILQHNAQVSLDRQFTLGSVTTRFTSGDTDAYTNYGTTMEEFGKLVNEYGGYLRVRYDGDVKYLDYLEDGTHQCSQVVELGKNLIDYQSNLDASNIVTAVIPLGSKRIPVYTQTMPLSDYYWDISSVNGGNNYLYNPTAVAEYGYIRKVVHFDDISNENTLKTAGQDYLNNLQFDNTKITIKALDFSLLTNKEPFRMLDKIHVISPKHGMDRWFLLTELTLNLNNPAADTISLGGTPTTISKAVGDVKLYSTKKEHDKLVSRVITLEAK